MCPQSASAAANTFLITRNSDGDDYQVWAFDPSTSDLVSQVALAPGASFPKDAQLVAVGDYLLGISPLEDGPVGTGFGYIVIPFNPASSDPLSDASPVQGGWWSYEKFWDYYAYADCPGGPPVTALQFIPITGYVLSFLPTEGRGTFSLWNFDADALNPGQSDPLPERLFDQDAFPTIAAGHVLLPVGNYVLDWVPETSSYTVWSFDPQKPNPLSLPVMSSGTFTTIDSTHQLVVVGEYVLDWVPSTRAYTLWAFDPTGTDPLTKVVQTGVLPAGFTPTTTVSSLQTKVPINPVKATVPGTMDFMRSNIKHVIYYVLESRSFDNVLGWLHSDQAEGLNWVNAEAPFQGASSSHTNSACGQTIAQYQFQGGGLSTDYDLNSPSIDPFHGTPDSIQQQWSGGYAAYEGGAAADMKGFVANNGTGEVMVTFSAAQLPILCGLADSFAVSDAWFCSAPGGTTTNRAYLASGSAYNLTVSYEGGSAYTDFPKQVHRQSMWKVLANNGITDWTIYSSIDWGNPPFPYTYHLYVKNQIPSVDANQARYVQKIDSFFTAAANGTLPAFSFLEPVWFDPSGVFTSYHPTGDVIPGEVALNKIYDAIRSGPGWDQTVLVISFSKGGGIYDHVPPPFAKQAWPHDLNDGFSFDALGARVPTIVVSPWVKPKTVFRSGSTEVPFDHTSLTATVLEWFGIPRARWGLGDRVPVAPTFETVLQESAVRPTSRAFTPAWDKTYPPPPSDDASEK